MPQLLLELFSEEIPARIQGQAARDLDRMARERLAAASLGFDSLRTYAGPRRLTLAVDGLPLAQADRTEEVKGPRANAPPHALEGFLRKTGLTREALNERDGVLFAHLARPGRPTPEIVAEMVEAIVRGFPWPKSMTWGSGTLRWVRPLKRIVCVFDGAVVPFQVDGIAAGDLTEGHRFMGEAPGVPFAVSGFDDYAAGLASRFVVLDAAERRARIAEGARAVCAAEGLELVPDDGLLDEVAGLAEWPVPILGRMDPAFLDLPPEVIRTSMRTHQKYFATLPLRSGGSTPEGGEGGSRPNRLAPYFVVVANIEATDGGAALAAGNARVLSARLNDARFFWEQDRAVPLESRLEALRGVTFHAKLGTMYERVLRIEALAREIAPLVGADPELAARAARLCKADLAGGMVGEFPELQGVMGGYYARAEGLPDAVADAVRDHYKPVGPSDSVPTAPVTVAVALADKLDTLVGFFAIDERPTGSKDPYALRRAALGVIRLVLGNHIRLPISEFLPEMFYRVVGPEYERHIEALRAKMVLELDRGLQTSKEIDFIRSAEFPHFYALMEMDRHRSDIVDTEGLQKLVDVYADHIWRVNQRYIWRNIQVAIPFFFADRLKVLLREEGRRHDLVDAVFALGDDDLVRIVARVEALDAFLQTEDGATLLAGYKRAANILRIEEKKDGVAYAPLDLSPSAHPGGSRGPGSQPDASSPVPWVAASAGRSGENLSAFAGMSGEGGPPEQTALVEALARAEAELGPRLAAEDFSGAMEALARLRAPVDAFFDRVLVNVPEPEVRADRLRLLATVRAAADRVADFSKISG